MGRGFAASLLGLVRARLRSFAARRAPSISPAGWHCLSSCCKCMLVWLTLTLLRCPAADGLVDHPIAADSITYLNGKWTASTELMPPRSADCTWEDNTDYAHGSNHGGYAPSESKEECCALCAKQPTCAAAVFALGRGGSCWFKTQSDMANKSTVNGVTACVVKSTPGTGGKKLSIPATVPGDLITDLESAGIIGDPLYELNWLNSTIWDVNTWTYSTSFTAPATGTSVLVFDGVKMGAYISTARLSNITDQFLRYGFWTLKKLVPPHA